MGAVTRFRQQLHGGKTGWRSPASYRKDVVWLVVCSLVLNGGLWCTALLHQSNILIPGIGLAVILLNTGLIAVLLRKEAVLAQALGITACTVQLLLFILIIHATTFGQ